MFTPESTSFETTSYLSVEKQGYRVRYFNVRIKLFLATILIAFSAQAEDRLRVSVPTDQILNQNQWDLKIPSLGLVKFKAIRKRPQFFRVSDGSKLNQFLNYNAINGVVASRARTKSSSHLKRNMTRAAAVIVDLNNSKYFSLHFTAEGAKGRIRFYRLTGRLSPQSKRTILKLYRVLSIALVNKHCASDLLPQSSKVISTGSKDSYDLHIASDVKVIDISFDADQQFAAKYGNDAASEIAATVNAVNVIYQDQLGLRLDLQQAIIRQNSVTYPNSITEIFNGTNGMIESFTSRVNNSNDFSAADAYHMLSARDYTPYLGIAWQQTDSDRGVVCRDRTRSMGVSSAFFNSAVTHLTVAHELGHNLSAEHGPNGDSAPFTTGIMSPVLDLNNLPSLFSSFSVGEITNYVANNGTCLATGQATPSPTPTIASSPTVTPVSSPRPTATIGGGGGGGGGGGTDPNSPTTTPNLASSLSVVRKNGVVTFNIVRQNVSSCEIALLASAKNLNIPQSGKKIFSIAASDAKSLVLSANLKDKVNRAKNGTKPKAFFVVAEACSAGTYYSDSVGIKFNDAVQTRGKSVLGWSTTLGKRLTLK